MRKARWLAEWRKSAGKPVFYHVISRVVDRRFAFGPEEKDIIEGRAFNQSLFLPFFPRPGSPSP